VRLNHNARSCGYGSWCLLCLSQSETRIRIVFINCLHYVASRPLIELNRGLSDFQALKSTRKLTGRCFPDDSEHPECCAAVSLFWLCILKIPLKLKGRPRPDDNAMSVLFVYGEKRVVRGYSARLTELVHYLACNLLTIVLECRHVLDLFASNLVLVTDEVHDTIMIWFSRALLSSTYFECVQWMDNENQLYDQPRYQKFDVVFGLPFVCNHSYRRLAPNHYALSE